MSLGPRGLGGRAPNCRRSGRGRGAGPLQGAACRPATGEPGRGTRYRDFGKMQCSAGMKDTSTARVLVNIKSKLISDM